MSATRILTAACALAVLAAPLAAQNPEQRIQHAMDRVQAQGMPAELLQDKLAEGLAKNVPMDRIAAVIETRALHMAQAQVALQRAQQGPPSAADLAVGADAIGAGVSEAVLAEIASEAGPERRTVALAALAYLAGPDGGLPEAARVDHALEMVMEALDRGGPGLGDLQQIAQRAREQQGIGGPPAGVPAPGKPGGVGRPGRPGGGPPNSL